MHGRLCGVPLCKVHDAHWTPNLFKSLRERQLSYLVMTSRRYFNDKLKAA